MTRWKGKVAEQVEGGKKWDGSTAGGGRRATYGGVK